MNVAVKAAKHAAPGAYLGFALQPVRLCFHLLTCPKGAKVSLEVLDDVAIHDPDGTTVLEQIKSALKHNALSDWAPDLWKTLANWLDSAESGSIVPEKSEFRIYVSPLWTGSWAEALSDSKSDSDVKNFTQTMASLFKKKRPTACTPYVQRFLAAADDERAAIVTRLEIVSEEDPLEGLRSLIRTAVGEDLVDVLCKAAIGMAKEQADGLIRIGKPAIIDGDRFKANFVAFVQRNNIPGLLSSLTSKPEEEAVAAVLGSRPTFIRQLEIIDATEDDRVRAVSDFLRASSDKSRWAEAGLIFDRSLDDLDDSLIRRHGLISAEVADLFAKDDAPFRGRQTYRRCAQLQLPIDGRSVPDHFVHGCFNALADLMQLGWHPDYETLLASDEE
ncbi:ABC-three component system protein [Bradyrhizobium erythrophlei]|uniref:ABC-three component system protein n=1 Tax=Bradyrhizobium erythrophlei TaxID=1437360 RepID=UPI0035F0BC8D